MTKIQKLAKLRRRSGAAAKKLESLLRIGSAVLRDRILDQALNEDARSLGERRLRARGALETARDVAVATGLAYRDVHLTNYSLVDWFLACGLDRDGNFHEGLGSEGSTDG